MSEEIQRPYPFSDLPLARRLERAEAQSNASFVEARAIAFPESSPRWIEVAGTYAMFDGVSSPITQTFGLGLFGDLTDAELSRIECFFEERGARVFHEVSPMAGLPVFAFLSDRGYRPVELTSVMYRPLWRGMDLGLAVNDEIGARPIADTEHGIWAQTAARGWAELVEFPSFFTELGQINPHRKDAVMFLAERGGQPIAAGALGLCGGVGLLAGACTVPEARRQGAQLALLEARLRFAAEHGAELAMMCAQPGSRSQRNAERQGFRIAYTRTKWGK